MDRLNYHHLRYFREVAHEGHLTRAAERLNLSQSALSTQIKQLEERLGHALFERKGRQLILTEAGRIALDHAERIFGTGEDLLAALGDGVGRDRPLRVGALSTLSRNFQIRFLKPVLGKVPLALVSGSAATLLPRLAGLSLDVVLSTDPHDAAAYPELMAERIAAQPVALIGTPERVRGRDSTGILSRQPLIVPTESSIRTGFDALCARKGIVPKIAAEVDDMAMVRLLARQDVGVALAPAVVMADEIGAGVLTKLDTDLGIVESFYAITAKRNFPHPALMRLPPMTRFKP
ncbi:LysR family transcriptional regulator [Roseicyclus mahoneyensis]|uniref:LysR family transcriptional activator of nhaA n=1 Tax=Roseicyclus mahoneyensis TaxID=164332 RepID=A0A316GLD5_9RHOB|nr:LysR family transcriptional regulator [Roseicyclus mahoneyensis]PWK60208.1 LysR family transcriptional activator of nhaA [Roseicyclus mahoneyensis]